MVTIFSPCVRSVASAKGWRTSTSSPIWFHSLAVNIISLCPPSVRTVDSFRWSQLTTDFSCLSVEFQCVVTEAGIPRCPNSSSNFSLKEVLVWSKELNLEALTRAALTNLVSLRPSPITNWRVCAKHWSLIWVFALKEFHCQVVPNVRIIKLIFFISLSWKTCSECFFHVSSVVTDDVFNLCLDLVLFTYLLKLFPLYGNLWNGCTQATGISTLDGHLRYWSSVPWLQESLSSCGLTICLQSLTHYLPPDCQALT